MAISWSSKELNLPQQVQKNTCDIAELQKKIPIPGPKGDTGVGIKSVMIMEVQY